MSELPLAKGMIENMFDKEPRVSEIYVYYYSGLCGSELQVSRFNPFAKYDEHKVRDCKKVSIDEVVAVVGDKESEYRAEDIEKWSEDSAGTTDSRGEEQ